MLDFSCSWQMLTDQQDQFSGHDMLREVYNKIFTLEKGNMIHAYKFRIWVKSMQFRYMMEGLFTFILTILF